MSVTIGSSFHPTVDRSKRRWFYQRPGLPAGAQIMEEAGPTEEETFQKEPDSQKRGSSCLKHSQERREKYPAFALPPALSCSIRASYWPSPEAKGKGAWEM